MDRTKARGIRARLELRKEERERNAHRIYMAGKRWVRTRENASIHHSGDQISGSIRASIDDTTRFDAVSRVAPVGSDYRLEREPCSFVPDSQDFLRRLRVGAVPDSLPEPETTPEICQSGRANFAPSILFITTLQLSGFPARIFRGPRREIWSYWMPSQTIVTSKLPPSNL